MTIEEYFGKWSGIVDLREANRLMRELGNQKNICPLPKNIFKCFHLRPLQNTRVVIIGQDPYPTTIRSFPWDSYQGRVPTATGLAFANVEGTPEKDYSPSLAVLRDSVIDYSVPHKRINFDPSLEKWAKQGVLLLNSALSCEKGKPGSHALKWRPFITDLLINLNKHTTGMVYVLMGTQAQSFSPYINSASNHVLTCHHPAWYARNRIRMPPDIWKKINNILIDLNGYGIEWYSEEQS